MAIPLLSASHRAAAETPAASVSPPPQTWVDQVKHPVSWCSWGADERIRWEYIPNLFLTEADPPGHNFSVIRIRSRAWASISPTDAFSLNGRLTYEPRYYFEPQSRDGWDGGEGLVDNLNAKLKFPKSGLTLTVGRQDIIFGNGWLILEGTPLDGSRTIYFDAARATMEMKDLHTTLDAVLLYDAAKNNGWLPPIDADEVKPQIEQDETGAILYATNKSIKGTQLDGYFIYKHGNRVLANGYDADIYAPGLRVIHEFDPHWLARAEGVYELGNKNGEDLSAWGVNSRLTYRVGDPAKNEAWLGYEALSGDDPDSSTNEQFDPLWARWPQWSELYIYTYAVETRIAEVTNLQRINLGWQCEPNKKLYLSANYHALFAMENSRAGSAGFSGSGKFRGHLFTAMASYKFNRFVSGNVVGEYLLPENYYRDPAGDSVLDSRRDPAAYVRFEMMFTF